MSELAEKRLGDFEIVRQIGRGGMGVVYEARQVSLNRKVALKVLSSSLGLSSQAVPRFRREAEAAAKLHHTNIVPIYATGSENGTHFYAMELIEGPSLDVVIRQLRQAQPEKSPAGTPSGMATTSPGAQSTIPPENSAPALTSSSLSSDSHYFDTAARIIAEVADGLDYAHQQGVVHRDLKPSNLLLSPEGRLSINDFGLARMLEQPGMTMTGEFVGTPAYMSPEQITAGRVPVNHRTDIYSLGATLYELLTLEPPFVGERRDQLLAQILHKEPRPPRRVNRKVPVDLETICLKAMDKDPDRRYQTAGDLAADLRRYLNRFAIAARRAGPVERLQKWVKRHPGLAAAIACAVVALVAAGAFAYRAHIAEQAQLVQKRDLEEKLRQEKLQAALDKALLAAMCGEFDEAEQAIAQAELLDASHGQVRLLQSYVAFQRDDRKKAIEHAEQAVKLMPNSVAPVALLARFSDAVDDWATRERLLAKAAELSMKTPEDFLFRAQAEGLVDPARALKWLDQAGQLLASPIGRLTRAVLQIYLAEDTAKVEHAQQAIKDAIVAQQLLPEHRFARTVYARAQLCLAHAYQKAGDTQKRQESLAQAKGEIDRIRKDDPARGNASLVHYYLLADDKHAALLASQAMAESRDSGGWKFVHAAALYERGRFKEALENFVPQNDSSDILLACLRAELEGPIQARQVFETLSNLPERKAGTGPLYHQTILRLLGNKEEAEQVSRAVKQGSPKWPWRKGWYQDLLDYSCGTLSAEQLIQKAGGSQFNLCEAHYFIGVTCLADGDRKGAMSHFEQAIDNPYCYMHDHVFSRAFLGRMQADPNWPPWIATKSDDQNEG